MIKMKNNPGISIKTGLKMKDSAWIDVRCPREFSRGHFTNAINIPIFSDAEYKELGITYRIKGQEEAIKLGESYAKKSTPHILNQFSNLDSQNFIVYCARGGMRSKGMEIILNSSPNSIYRIDKGYKSIRKYSLNAFDQKNPVIIIAGSTGTGKTDILKNMRTKGYNIIDLEGLASHRGSAFGDLGLKEQPTQQQFENNLSMDWENIAKGYPVFIESESRRIGKLVIPEGLWNQMEAGYYLKINMNLDRRVNNLINEYGHHKINKLQDRVKRISKRLGDIETKDAINLLADSNLFDFCKLLLNKYYDKMYGKAYEMRDSQKGTLDIENESNNDIIKRIVELI